MDPGPADPSRQALIGAAPARAIGPGFALLRSQPAPHRGWSARLSRALALGAAGLVVALGAHASSLRYCDGAPQPGLAQQARLLRVAAELKSALEDSGARLALVARSGLNLAPFDQRYSHAGLSLKASTGAPWSVRQLYYACDEQQARLFDQGLTAFLAGSEDPARGFLSVLLLPTEAQAALEPVAADNARVLSLLGARYSANAYAFSVQYQNCNQWLAELLATAWGGLAPSGDPRGAAQSWLQAQGYQPTVFQLPFRAALWLTALSPWLHSDDHPETDLQEARLRVSMPASLEAWARTRWPGSQRLELCHTPRHLVLRRGGEPLAESCEPGPGDQVVALD